jgi:hypothetical protein
VEDLFNTFLAVVPGKTQTPEGPISIMRTGFQAGSFFTRRAVRIKGVAPYLSILTMLAFAPTMPAAQGEELVAYYPLNGNARDASRNKLDGTVTGATATLDRYGNSGGALLFENDGDRVNCGNPAAFNFSGPFTISAWVNLSGTRENSYIVAKYDFDFSTMSGSPHSYGLGIAGLASPYGFIGGQAGFAETAAPTQLRPGQWHALAFVYTGSSINLYLDGNHVAGRNVAAFPAFINAVPLTLGGTAVGQVFGGAIDDVRIYSRALSNVELSAQYQADVPPEPPTSDFLVAHYELHGNAHDKSGNGLHGTLVGTTPMPDRFGKPGHALHFDGGIDRVNCGNPAEFNFGGTFTLSAWVKLDGPQINRYVVAKYDFDPASGSSPFCYGLGIGGSSDPYGFVGAQAGFQDLFGGLSMSDDEWHAIAFVYEGNNSLRLYLDGDLARVRPIPLMAPFINSVPLTIGGTSTGQGFAGGIDDVRIYSKALSSSEVGAQFDADAPTLKMKELKVGLVAFYPLNGNAQDRSGNQFDGTLVGTTATEDRFGKPNGALLFNGLTDRIFCGNPAEFNFTNDFTLNAWIKVDGAQINRYVVAKYDFDFATSTGAPNSFGLGLDGQTDPYGFVGGDTGFIDVVRPVNLDDGKWHFLSLVYEAGSALRLFLDGAQLAAAAPGSLPPFVNSLPLTIGGTSSGQGFRGAIDDVRIYNRALSEEEIIALFLK